MYRKTNHQLKKYYRRIFCNLAQVRELEGEIILDENYWAAYTRGEFNLVRKGDVSLSIFCSRFTMLILAAVVAYILDNTVVRPQ